MCFDLIFFCDVFLLFGMFGQMSSNNPFKDAADQCLRIQLELSENKQIMEDMKIRHQVELEQRDQTIRRQAAIIQEYRSNALEQQKIRDQKLAFFENKLQLSQAWVAEWRRAEKALISESPELQRLIAGVTASISVGGNKSTSSSASSSSSSSSPASSRKIVIPKSQYAHQKQPQQQKVNGKQMMMHQQQQQQQQQQQRRQQPRGFLMGGQAAAPTTTTMTTTTHPAAANTSTTSVGGAKPKTTTTALVQQQHSHGQQQQQQQQQPVVHTITKITPMVIPTSIL